MFAADNVDVDIRTIDGKGTFHGMGIICTTTPCRKVCPSICIKRDTVFKEDITSSSIRISYFKGEDQILLGAIKFEPLNDICVGSHDRSKDIDGIRIASCLLRPQIQQ